MRAARRVPFVSETIVRHLLVGLGLLASIGQLSTPVGAQRYRWWRIEAVQLELRLTRSQVESLEALFDSTLEARRALRRELDRREQSVQQLLTRGEVDDTQAIEAINQLETARARRNAARTIMLFRMYRVLSPEQRQALKRLTNSPSGATTAPIGEGPKPTPSPR